MCLKYQALCMVQRRSSVMDSYFSEMIVVNTIGWIPYCGQDTMPSAVKTALLMLAGCASES